MNFVNVLLKFQVITQSDKFLHLHSDFESFKEIRLIFDYVDENYKVQFKGKKHTFENFDSHSDFDVAREMFFNCVNLFEQGKLTF